MALGLLLASVSFSQTGDSDSPSTRGGPPAQTKQSKDKKSKNSSEPPATKLQLQVTGADNKPVSNASVYIGFYESGGFLRHEKLAELDLKTNQDGSVKIPEIPQGKIRIQIVAKGWHTFGKWYDVEKPEDLIEIKLEAPPHWY